MLLEYECEKFIFMQCTHKPLETMSDIVGN